ncbi:hypothetical protein [Breznakia pachnodae]|uniref:FtsK domain-containing protein n=1 Tax=Breznakia pachnodae TaxID=265178 RepID=A0ABU0DZS0_9FIRM|nr:hypothetical protein [Breznakia pachnodae]MDQ0359978.1 hypothetical protein [Breznakia pachnodae]
MKKRYKQVPNFYSPKPFFYISKLPSIIIYKVKSLIQKNDGYDRYMIALSNVNLVREFAGYFAEKDNQKRETLKVYYKIEKNRVDIKYRFYKKAVENDYEQFREMVGLHTYLTTQLHMDAAHGMFSIAMQIIPEMTYDADRFRVTVGTDIFDLVYWVFSDAPHMLLIGPTQNGKTTMMYYLLNGLLSAGFEIDMCDGKGVDYALCKHQFRNYIDNDVTNPDNNENILNLVRNFHSEMMWRKEELLARGVNNYKHTEDMMPKFLFLDEYILLTQQFEKKQREKLQALILDITLIGGALGCNLVVTMQRADAQFIGGLARDNFMFKMVIGKASSESYHMIFNDSSIKPLTKGKAWYTNEEKPKMLAFPLYTSVIDSGQKEKQHDPKEESND